MTHLAVLLDTTQLVGVAMAPWRIDCQYYRWHSCSQSIFAQSVKPTGQDRKMSLLSCVSDLISLPCRCCRPAWPSHRLRAGLSTYVCSNSQVRQLTPTPESQMSENFCAYRHLLHTFVLLVMPSPAKSCTASTACCVLPVQCALLPIQATVCLLLCRTQVRCVWRGGMLGSTSRHCWRVRP